MVERLYAGSVPADQMPRIVAACAFTQDAFFLAEDIPHHLITSSQEGRDLLHIAVFEEKLAYTCATLSSGRIFQEDRELRWENRVRSSRSSTSDPRTKKACSRIYCNPVQSSRKRQRSPTITSSESV